MAWYESMRLNASVAAILLTIFGVVSIGEALHIQGKAMLAQLLIERAWQKTLADSKPVRPWHWADTWPVARLRFERDDESLMVLAGASGASLPFGPAHVYGTSYPGEAGTSVIAGHRDTHFRILADTKIGDVIAVQSRDGAWTQYAVDSLDVIDTREHPVWTVPLARDELQLITCYPFNTAAPGGPMRLVVTAQRSESLSVEL